MRRHLFTALACCTLACVLVLPSFRLQAKKTKPEWGDVTAIGFLNSDLLLIANGHWEPLQFRDCGNGTLCAPAPSSSATKLQVVALESKRIVAEREISLDPFGTEPLVIGPGHVIVRTSDSALQLDAKLSETRHLNVIPASYFYSIKLSPHGRYALIPISAGELHSPTEAAIFDLDSGNSMVTNVRLPAELGDEFWVEYNPRLAGPLRLNIHQFSGMQSSFSLLHGALFQVLSGGRILSGGSLLDLSGRMVGNIHSENRHARISFDAFSDDRAVFLHRWCSTFNAIRSFDACDYNKGLLEVFEMPTGKRIYSQTMDNATVWRTNQLAISPDGKKLVLWNHGNAELISLP